MIESAAFAAVLINYNFIARGRLGDAHLLARPQTRPQAKLLMEVNWGGGWRGKNAAVFCF